MLRKKRIVRLSDDLKKKLDEEIKHSQSDLYKPNEEEFNNFIDIIGEDAYYNLIGEGKAKKSRINIALLVFLALMIIGFVTFLYFIVQLCK